MNSVARIKECPDKPNEYDLEGAWSHDILPFFRDSNLIFAPTNFLVDDRSECTSKSFVRNFSNTYIFSELL